MIVERKDDELRVKLSANVSAERIQAILDYLRYEELTASSSASEFEVQQIVADLKKGRWDKTQEDLGLDD